MAPTSTFPSIPLKERSWRPTNGESGLTVIPTSLMCPSTKSMTSEAPGTIIRFLMVSTITDSGLMIWSILRRSWPKRSFSFKYSGLRTRANLTIYGFRWRASKQAIRLTSSLSVAATSISASSMPESLSVSGLVPEPRMTWTSRFSVIRLTFS